jgi:putative transposase
MNHHNIANDAQANHAAAYAAHGSAGDNAAMESFFALLQKNVLNTKRWETRDELRIAIVTWIERTYHRRRRWDSLGRLTPVEYEAIMTPLVTKAA